MGGERGKVELDGVWREWGAMSALVDDDDDDHDLL